MVMQPLRLELPTGLPVASVNTYLFTDPEPILIDSGVNSPESWDALVRGLRQHGLAVADLSRVIITHAHIDHYGQAGAIAAHSKADVWISDLGRPWLEAPAEQWARRGRFYSDYFLPALGLPEPAARAILGGIQAMESLGSAVPGNRLHTFALDSMLDLGGRPWQILHTPGHASTQTCFYEPEQAYLLSADMLLATTPTPVVESPSDGTFNRVPALPRFMESLDLVDALAIEQVLPGHGQPFTDHHRLIERQRARILARKQECLDLINAGYHTVSALLDQMYAHQPLQLRFAGLWMLVGYLDLLEAGAQIEQQSLDGIWHYYPVAPKI